MLWNVRRAPTGRDQPQMQVTPSPPHPKLSVFRETGDRLLLLDTVRETTHIGRQSFSAGRRCGQVTSDLRQTTVANDILLGRDDQHVSRIHALLEPIENGGWAVRRINDSNVVLVDGVKIGYNTQIPLNDGAILTLGDVELRIEHEKARAALLVISSGGSTLAGQRSNASEMRRVLERRGFTVTELSEDKAVKNGIYLACHEIGKSIGKGTFFFYYSGHGNNGAVLSNNGKMSPYTIFDATEQVGSERVVLADCCHGFDFTSEKIPKSTLVIAGQDPDGYLYQGAVTRDRSADDDGEQRELPRGAIFAPYMGFLTRAFVKRLDENPGYVDLRPEASELGKYRRLEEHECQVVAEGKRVLLPPTL